MPLGLQFVLRVDAADGLDGLLPPDVVMLDLVWRGWVDYGVRNDPLLNTSILHQSLLVGHVVQFIQLRLPLLVCTCRLPSLEPLDSC